MRDFVELCFSVDLPKLTDAELNEAFSHAARVRAVRPDADIKLTAGAYLASRYRRVV